LERSKEKDYYFLRLGNNYKKKFAAAALTVSRLRSGQLIFIFIYMGWVGGAEARGS
jgi:hypothetical protein